MTARDKRRKRGSVAVSGPWLPMPLWFLGSRACAELSPHALKMLVDLCSQLRPNAVGNGDLSAAPSVMRPRGWTSNETRQAAIAELIAADLVCMTRQGGRHRCSLYAVTLWPMDCDFAKLDHGPGCYSVNDWRGPSDARATSPSLDKPAIWGSPRKSKAPCPAAGKAQPALTPPRDKQSHGPPSIDPAAGLLQSLPAISVAPPRATYLDMPSGVVQS